MWVIRLSTFIQSLELPHCKDIHEDESKVIFGSQSFSDFFGYSCSVSSCLEQLELKMADSVLNVGLDILITG